LEYVAERIKADPKRLQLYKILSHQIRLIINDGKSDLGGLLTSLKAAELVSEADIEELSLTYALEAVRLPILNY
jgi:hypothetical protein